MEETPKVEEMLRSHRRRVGLADFTGRIAQMFGNAAELTELPLGELLAVLATDRSGKFQSWNHSAPEISEFLNRIIAAEAGPVYVVEGIRNQTDFGAVLADASMLLPNWQEMAETYGLYIVSADRESWAMIDFDDHFVDGYDLTVLGRWSELRSVAPRNRQDIRHRIEDVFENGKHWLDGVDLLVDDLARDWNLELEQQTIGNYSFVIPAGEHVLKLLPPSDNLNRELTTMLAWNGNGAAKIHKHDADRGAMLIERLRPGAELTTLYHQGRDEEATEIACTLMPRLTIPQTSNSPIPTAADRAADLQNLRKRFNGKTGPFPPHLVEAAETLFKDLIASQGPPHLIHADLHHENILQSERGWLAIDPHGLIAEREFEAYSWLNNPNGLSKNPDLKAITKRRLHQISDLTGFDRERIRGWAIACAVLSSWWSFDGHGAANEADLTVAEVLLGIWT